MSKSFRELIEAINKKKDELRPRSGGEADFAKSQGYPASDEIGGENDREYPAKGTDDVLNARKAKETHAHNNKVAGERSPIQQGTSKTPSRFKNFGKQSVLVNKFKAKTGSMTGVRSYSGILTKSNGEKIAISFIINDYSCNIKILNTQILNLISQLL